MTVQFVAPTPRKKINRKEAARLFLLHNGICANCGQQIRSGDAWFIEHPEALVLGGADTDANRKPAHVKCKADKDASDAAARAKRDRIITADYRRDEDHPRSHWSGPGFRKAPPQHSATRPLRRKSERTSP